MAPADMQATTETVARIGATDAVAIAVALERHRRAARPRLLEFQAARLRRLIAHAYGAVPYYRALLERHGVRPDQVRTAADLALVPVTSRRELQRAPMADRLARGSDPARLLAYRTSGSAGVPLVVHRTWLEERVNSACRLRALREFGLRPGDVRVTLRAGLGVLGGVPPRGERAQRVLRALGLYRKLTVDYRAAPAQLVEQLAAHRPDVLTGLPSVLAELARAVRPEQRPRLRPRLVVCGGEVLTEAARQHIASGLGARVTDLYGSHELGVIAWQCPAGAGLHVADDSLVLEVVKDGRSAEPGETGEVVATRLHAYAMPFIRYRLGDLATRGPSPCPCGAPFSTILAVEGRVAEYFPMPDGSVLHPNALLHVVYHHAARWVARFQLTQETLTRLVLRVVPLAPPSADDLAALAAAARARLGPAVDFEVLLVQDIPLDPTGKFRASRSLVSSGPVPDAQPG